MTQNPTETSGWRSFFTDLAVAGATTFRPGPWFSLSQLQVDLYGSLIADLDPMHNDTDWEAGRPRWGGTIIIGSHVLSMLPQFLASRGFPVNFEGVRFTPVTLPRVRFVAPLPIDHQARDHLSVTRITSAAGAWTVCSEHRVERQGLERPFLYAQFICRFEEV